MSNKREDRTELTKYTITIELDSDANMSDTIELFNKWYSELKITSIGVIKHD